MGSTVFDADEEVDVLSMKLHIELAPQHKQGLSLRNPVILAAGTCGYGVETARSAEVHRLGALVSSSVRQHAYAGDAHPLVLETASGLLSAFERTSPGVHKVVKAYASTWASWQTPVIVSLAGATIDEFAALATRLDGVPGVATLELNLASLSLDDTGKPCGSDSTTVERLVTTVRQCSTLPLIVKLPSFHDALSSIALVAASAGADALTLGGAQPALCINVQTRQPVLFGALSGPAIKPLALRLFYDLAREMRATYPQVPLIGNGGITNAQDALEYLMAGATAVQIGTASLVNPRAGVEVVEGIETFLQREGVADVAEIIGAALPA